MHHLTLRWPLAAGLGLLLSACGPKGPTFDSDVQPLLQARCLNCHTTGGIAPFSMQTYAQVKQMAPAMLDAVKQGRMPPWKAGPADVIYIGNPQLTAEQVATLEQWVTDGMPEGDPKAKKAVVAPVGGGLERVDLTLQVPEPYTPTKSPDDYRCFPIRWPSADPVYLTGFNAIPGQPSEVHHIALYQVPPDSADLPFQWDAEEDGPGYTCFGGPFGSHPQNFPVNVVSAWIPGTGGLTYPRGLGVEVPPGSTLVLQVHYNTQQGALLPDQTKLEFSTATQVAGVAAYQPYLDPAWVAGAMTIPAGQSNVMFQAYSDPRDFFTVLGSPLDLTNGFNIEGVMFHMHKLGTIGQLWLEKASGTRIKVLEIPQWDFHWQLQYMLEQPLRFEPGDKLRLRCTFDNSPGRLDPNQPNPHDVNWGEGSDDEMCVANIFSSQ
jgi:hypothetical protein